MTRNNGLVIATILFLLMLTGCMSGAPAVVYQKVMVPVRCKVERPRAPLIDVDAAPTRETVIKLIDYSIALAVALDKCTGKSK